MLKKIIISIVSLAYLIPFLVSAQVFNQSQIFLPPYGANGWLVSTSTSLGSKLFASSSPYFSAFTFASASGTNATTTNFGITGILSKLLKTDGAGYVVGAVAGTDYLQSMSFAWPWTKLSTGEQATSTTILFNGSNSFIATASSTLASTTASSLLVTGSASSSNLFTNNLLTWGSSTIQSLFFPSGTSTNLYSTNFLNIASSTLASTTIGTLTISTSATGTNIFANNFTGLASSTFQRLFSTSATATNLYATNFLGLASSTLSSTTISQLFVSTSATSSNEYANNLTVLASSTIQKLFATSATGTNLYATNFLALASSTFQGLFSTSATATNLYFTNLLANGSSTLQNATSSDFYVSGISSSTNFRANVANIGNLTVTSCTGCPGSSFAWPFTKLGTNEQATSTTLVFTGANSLIATASSTLASTTVSSLLATSATTTNLYAGATSTLTNLLIRNANTPSSAIGAALEIASGRSNGNLTAGQSGDIAIQYGGAGGGTRHFIVSNNNTAADIFSNSIAFYLNNTNTAEGSNSPGTGNSFIMGMYGNGFQGSGGRIGIGTTTPFYALTVSSSSAPQLALTDASLTSDSWTLRSLGNFFYVATSSPTKFSTSTVNALSIDPSGLLTVKYATTTALRANIADIGNLTVTSCTGCPGSSFAFPFTKQAGGEQSTTTNIGLYGGFLSLASSTVNSTLLVAGSTTLQNVTAQQATSSQLATTANYVTLGPAAAPLVLSATSSPDWIVASSTMTGALEGHGFNGGTSTFMFINGAERLSYPWIACKTATTTASAAPGGVFITLYNGTAESNYATCDGNIRQTVFTSVNSFAPFSTYYVRIGPASTTAQNVTIKFGRNKLSP